VLLHIEYCDNLIIKNLIWSKAELVGKNILFGNDAGL